MRKELQKYIEQNIIPRYDNFDAAHRREHVKMVIRESLLLAARTGADEEMAYTIAAYHDVGLVEGREIHHLASAEIIRKDKNLLRWFTHEQIELIAQAAEDHRASSEHAPRSLYGRIVAEADRFIDPETIIFRTIQYGLEHYPSLSREEHYNRMVEHLREKYYYGGYLRLWFEDSPNAQRLEQLRRIIADEQQLRAVFERYFKG